MKEATMKRELALYVLMAERLGTDHDRLSVLEEGANNVIHIDMDDFEWLAREARCRTPRTANPHDVSSCDRRRRRISP
jgi:PHD/YefM family antitoxin component YafN of YafNO toxin-antitoxin module